MVFELVNKIETGINTIEKMISEGIWSEAECELCSEIYLELMEDHLKVPGDVGDDFGARLAELTFRLVNED